MAARTDVVAQNPIGDAGFRQRAPPTDAKPRVKRLSDSSRRNFELFSCRIALGMVKAKCLKQEIAVRIQEAGKPKVDRVRLV